MFCYEEVLEQLHRQKKGQQVLSSIAMRVNGYQDSRFK
jgi:hypothetical protein